ncbi:MAG: hypothetical protein IT327_23760 [Anaerolineae bacterium]|nr:hypothetical protein [Anaerolineae bacterium]
MRQLSLLPQETWLQNGRFTTPLPADAPIIVSNGVAVDCVALLVELHRAQINLKKIRGLWGHGERMTEYIRRRGLLPASLLDTVWTKWVAEKRPSELGDNPETNADVVLFTEVRRLAALCR